MFKKIRIMKEVYSNLFELKKKGYTDAEIAKISEEIMNNISDIPDIEEAINVIHNIFTSY